MVQKLASGAADVSAGIDMDSPLDVGMEPDASDIGLGDELGSIDNELDGLDDEFGGMDAAATVYNAVPAAQKASKYVSDIQITGAATPWPIVVSIAATTGNGIPTGLNGQTLVFSPNVQGAAPTGGAQGAMDWACASDSASAAATRGLGSRTLGTLPAKYAPSECR